MQSGGKRTVTLRPACAIILLFAILTLQSSGAIAGQITIQYGQSWPQSIVVDSSRGLVYVDALSGLYPQAGFSFGVINATDHSLLKVLPLNETSGAMAYDQNKGLVYVAGTNTIGIYDGPGQTFLGQIGTDHPALYLAFDSQVSSNLYYVSRGSVFEVSPTTGKVVANATVGGEAGGLTIDPENGRLYVGNYVSPSVFVFNASDLKPIGTIVMPSCCATQLALNNINQTLYASSGMNMMDIIDVRTDTLVRSVSVAPRIENSTSYIAVDEGTGRVFVVAGPGGAVLELDSAGAVMGEFKLSSEPAGIAVDSRTGELYLTEYHGVAVFDARTNTTRDYTLAEVAALGAALGAISLVIVVRRQSLKSARSPT